MRDTLCSVKRKSRLKSCLSYVLLVVLCLTARAFGQTKPTRSEPFQDSVYRGGPQHIPGRVQCAYYDLGGEGIAYHDADAKNNGSGVLNPADGSYLNQFRMKEGVDISYTKFHDQIDNNPYTLVSPPEGQLYVGWTKPGEWFNMTVNVKHAGLYSADLLYTSNRGGEIALDLNGKKLTGPITVLSTYNASDPIAWRQWHHWNLMQDVTEVRLPKGVNVLTLRVVSQGNMNFAYLEFKRKN
ncbi:MAG: hypothetical protein JWO91_2553 [Acidobacteriaceae bacterium]|nr:hypothetical protein [Acidobacteriaceae bacterium]